MRMLLRLGAGARRHIGDVVVRGFFHTASRLGRLHPNAKPERHAVEHLRDIRYQDGDLAEHLLDVYRPVHATNGFRKYSGPPWPVVFYIHGGGFRFLSKDTHWVMALSFARAGYLVFNVSYRLAPRHPFPAAVEDVCDAWRYAMERAAEFGGDRTRVVVAGESAGANVATTLTLATCYERAEPYARKVFDVGIVPRACLPMCGILQVSDPARFARGKKLSRFLADRLEEVSEAYLFGHEHATPEELELADPLRVLERGDRPARPLPPFFAGVG